VKRLALIFFLLHAAAAQASLGMLADAGQTRGFIAISLRGSLDYGPVTVGEGKPGTGLIGTYQFSPYSTDRGGTPTLLLPERPAWRCDRTVRRFWVRATNAAGVVEQATSELQTPSCRNRLALFLPRHARPGVVHGTLRDTWGIGDTSASVCRGRKRPLAHCVRVRLPAGAAERKLSLPLRRRGYWRIRVRSPHQTVVQVVAVGVPSRPSDPTSGPTVLVTGDSLMESVEAAMRDALGARAYVVSDVHVASGLTRPSLLDWPALARQQVADHTPHVTVVFIGANDVYDMTTDDGEVSCGDAGWVAEYARRAGRMMDTYAQHGSGRVIWVTVPAAKLPWVHECERAVNAGLVRAARGRVVTLLRADHIFTPGFRYRDTMRDRGRRVRVRQSDGIHLSIAGARIVVRVIVRKLRRAHVI
jgi:lysophospholipase L1-like esterase